MSSAILSNLDIQAEKIVTDEAGAREEGVANPPKVCCSSYSVCTHVELAESLKVIYTDQHGHRVAHNPSTLDKSESSD